VAGRGSSMVGEVRLQCPGYWGEEAGRRCLMGGMEEEAIWHRFHSEEVARGHWSGGDGAGRRRRLLIFLATGGRRKGKWATGPCWAVKGRRGGGPAG
jgi:hypothetical protein